MATQQNSGTSRFAHSLSGARVLDAAGVPASIAAASDADHVRVRLHDGSELDVPANMLAEQDDGSFRLPFSLRGDDGDVAVRVPVHEERLHVDKRTVDTGRGIRVHKSVQEHQEVIDTPLEHDEMEVERIAIGTVVDEDQLPQPREDGDTWIVPIFEERLVVRKEVVLKEELRITRRKVSENRQQTVTLRSEQVDVERFDEQSGKSRSH